MTFVIAATITTFLVIAYVIGRQSKRNKQAAIADLEREKEQLAQRDIFTLVMAEIEDLELRSITGGADLQPAVLLKAWRDHSDVVERCADRARLRFVIVDGMDPGTATADDVTLVCEDGPDPTEADTGPAGDEDDD